MIRSLRKARGALIAAFLALIVSAGAAPAGAAEGVLGHLDRATIVDNCAYEVGCPAGYRSKVSVAGWAFNPRTQPNQEVRFVMTGYSYYAAKTVTFYSGKVLANQCRTDVQRAYGLSYCDVGYNSALYTPHWWQGVVTVCAQARDYGSTQAWRGVGCLNSQATSVYVP